MASERLNTKVVVEPDYNMVINMAHNIDATVAHDIAKLASSHGVGNIWFHPIRPIIPALACNDIVNPVLI